jgi:hypothetical protein
VDELQGRLLSQAPNFFPYINNAMATNLSNELTTVLLMNVTVINRGEPSSVIAQTWAVFATIAGVKRQIQMVAINPNTKVKTPSGDVIHINPSDAIYERGTKLVGTGEQITGWLQAQIPGIKRDEFITAGNAVEVSFSDFVGKAYTATLVIPDRPDHRLLYIPGSSPTGTYAKREGEVKR